VPLTAAVMNLFAAGASFGVVVAIFQWGWGSEALGVGKGGPIDAWAPVMFPRGPSTGWKKIFAPTSRSRSSRSASGVRGIGK
jgi:hypothetical protein